MGISDWPEGERPRERLLKLGPEALSDAELLAIFLRVGLPGKSAVDLARELIAHFGGDISKIAHAPVAALSALPGVGKAKAAQLLAAIELARRALAGQLASRDVLSSPKAVRDWLQLRLASIAHEVFIVLWLDSGNQLITSEELFRGTLDHTAVHPREVVKNALLHNAAAAIIAHNHPSGRAEASTADITLTQRLKESLALVDVRLLDHFIITQGRPPLSLAEAGKL